MASIHNRKLIAALAKELKVKDSEIQELKDNMTLLEDKLNGMYMEMKRNNKQDNKEP